MELQTSRSRPGNGPLPQLFHTEAEVTIMLQAFENELDAILRLIDSDRSKTVTEAIHRRYVTANDIFKDLDDRFQRVGFKMDMVSEHVLGEFSGPGVLESAREPDQTTT